MSLSDPFVLGGLVLGGVALLVGWLVVGSRRRARRLRTELQARRQSMGLRQTGAVAPQTIERIRELFRTPEGEAPRILEVWERQLDGARLYLFETSGVPSGRPQATALAAVHSAELDMPRLSLLPLLEQGGMLADLANQAMRMAFQRAANPVDFPSPADFIHRYLVGGPDEKAVRRFLDEDRRVELGKTRSWHLEGNQDLFVLTLMPLDGQRRMAVARDEEPLIREAMVALRLLRRTPAQTPPAPEPGA